MQGIPFQLQLIFGAAVHPQGAGCAFANHIVSCTIGSVSRGESRFDITLQFGGDFLGGFVLAACAENEQACDTSGPNGAG